MEINIENKLFKIGDKVRIIKITDESSRAVDLYGVEPQLDWWVSSVYIESFEGVIHYCKENLMIMIKGVRTSLPLSPSVRHRMYYEKYELIEKNDLAEAKEEMKLENTDYDYLMYYIQKLE